MKALLHNLCKHKVLVIQRADQNNTVAITKKNTYINKMKEIFTNTSKFEEINAEENKQLDFF